MAASTAGEGVWGAAAAAEPDATLRVDYDSTRSDERQTAEGTIERVAGRPEEGVMAIIFRRDDGQYMSVESDGAVKSIGSHFPLTGTIVDVEVEG